MKTLLLASALAAVSTGAHASNCALRTEVIDRMQSKFSESLVAGGLQGAGNVHTMVEVWASGQGGTFTIILSSPKGISCVVAAGTDFFTKTPPPQGEKS